MVGNPWKPLWRLRLLSHAKLRKSQLELRTREKAGSVIGVGFKIFRIATGVADMRIGQRNDLTTIGWIGEDFLIAGHRGIKNNFATGQTICTDGLPLENRTVGEGENGLSDAKKVLLVGRLTRRLKVYDQATFTQYYRMLASGEYPEELQTGPATGNRRTLSVGVYPSAGQVRSAEKRNRYHFTDHRHRPSGNSGCYQQ